MKHLSILFTLTLFLATQCAGDTGSSSDDESISLNQSLFEVGNTVSLQAASGDKVDGTTTDIDDDGSADGIDFNGDATIEIEYVLNVKSGARSNESVGFRFVGSDTVYYFLLDADEIVMSTTASLADTEAEEITLVVDAENETIASITFVDKEGNETTEELDVPFTFATTPKIVAASPADGSTIGGETAIVVYLSEAASNVSLGGDLGSQASYTLGNSTEGKTNDLLTITPVEAWSGGADQNLVLNLTAASGTAFDPVTLMFDVDLSGPTLVSSSFSGGEPTPGFYDNLFFTFDETITLENLNVLLSFFANHSAQLATTNVENDTLELILDEGESWGNECGGGTVDIDLEDKFGNTGSANLTGLTVQGEC